MFVQIILLIIFIVVCCTVFWYEKKEPFWFIPQGISICDDVTGLSRHQCKRCTNAGYCTLPNGEHQCVHGDSRGPYNGQYCQLYEYGDMANLSLIDPQEPLWVDMNGHWDWPSHLGKHHEYPKPISEEETFFRHGTHPLEHHRKI